MTILKGAMMALSSGGGGGPASTVSTVTIGNNSVVWGYSTYSGTFGSISGYTAIGSDDIRRIGTYSFTPQKGAPTYYVQLHIDGDHSSTPNWTSIEFLDATDSPSLNESSASAIYDSNNDITQWNYSVVGDTTSGIYKIWNYFTNNNGNDTDVEWTI